MYLTRDAVGAYLVAGPGGMYVHVEGTITSIPISYTLHSTLLYSPLLSSSLLHSTLLCSELSKGLGI